MKASKQSQHKRRVYAMSIVAQNHDSSELLSEKSINFSCWTADEYLQYGCAVIAADAVYDCDEEKCRCRR